MGADRTAQLAVEGYRFLDMTRQEYGSDVFDFRLLGVPVTGMTGPDAAELFYDTDRFERATALPRRVRRTLFGEHAVQSLDDASHRDRKALFMGLMTPDAISSLVSAVGHEWEVALAHWGDGEQVVLFDMASEVLTRGVCAWAGAPLPAVGATTAARTLVAMVDGFAAVGPRYRRAWRARELMERWARTVVEDVRGGALDVPDGCVAARVARHRGLDGRLLSTPVAAVELLNVIRPTVAVSWYVSFVAHALYRSPVWRSRIQGDGDDLVEGFAQEIRRFYPFAPFLGARVRHDFAWRGHEFPAGRLVLLDVYGMNHDPRLWSDPEVFDPERFTGRDVGPYDFIPQGGGDPDTGHRCAGERITIELVKQAARTLVRLDYEVPPQDLEIPLHRIPTRPRSGFVMWRLPATVGAYDVPVGG